MSKKSRFRRCFDKQYGKRSQTLLKSASQHLYHIHWSLARKSCSKKSLLLACQIFGLLVNTFATDEKYPVLNRENITITIQMILSEKKKVFLKFLLDFWDLSEILNLSKKKVSFKAFVFPKLRIPNTCLDKCLKSLVPEKPSTYNMVNGPKQCWNHHHSTFIIFINHCPGNAVEKVPLIDWQNLRTAF